MKIAIIGTRGIPNQYGGFEQFTEFVAPALVERGHQVFVYNSSSHPYMQSSYKKVQLIRCYDPESKIGTAGQFIYDLNCIRDSRKRNFDVILQLGYTSSSIWSFLYPKSSVLVTNMDGLEWKRSKYSRPVQKFLMRAERWAALYSDKLIADSKGIEEYLKKKYSKSSDFVAYGATRFTDAEPDVLREYNVTPYQFDLLIARMEPENNIETVLKAYQKSNTNRELFLIGNYTNNFGSLMKRKYEGRNIKFLGSIYNMEHLNNLRYFSHIYFHGHSVGGTNPSLLEAMASSALIVAHDNPFNRAVLESDALYFSSDTDIVKLFQIVQSKTDYRHMIENNRTKIAEDYSWEHITNLIERSLADALSRKTR